MQTVLPPFRRICIPLTGYGARQVGLSFWRIFKNFHASAPLSKIRDSEAEEPTDDLLLAQARSRFALRYCDFMIF